MGLWEEVASSSVVSLSPYIVLFFPVLSRWRRTVTALKGGEVMRSEFGGLWKSILV